VRAFAGIAFIDAALFCVCWLSGKSSTWQQHLYICLYILCDIGTTSQLAPVKRSPQDSSGWRAGGYKRFRRRGRFRPCNLSHFALCNIFCGPSSENRQAKLNKQQNQEGQKEGKGEPRWDKVAQSQRKIRTI